EGGIYEGLGLLPGEVRPIEEVIPKGLKIPEIGWNALRYLKPCPLFRHVPEGTEVYFVHSYAAMDAPDAVAVNEYGADLTAAAARGNLYGCQFHPEKSGRAGLEILRTFAEEIR
ncbi:MAG: imidazole glycerol phosphate synthase subunit HisH, partial [Lachnospiraceae bacterium]|nr:imidazole glycerol phosphate synthase subunit HisH [Lachnospiraceae bacterium]